MTIKVTVSDGHSANPWVTPIGRVPSGHVLLRCTDKTVEFGTSPFEAIKTGVSFRTSFPVPYQPGDVLEFYEPCSRCKWPSCRCFPGKTPEAKAEYFCNDCWNGVPMLEAKPTRRTVASVTAEQRDGQFVWVVEMIEASI